MKNKKFESIFEDYFESLRSTIYYKYNDMYLAEDIVQDAFLILWLNRNKVPLNKAKSYLLTVATNNLINYIKRQKVAHTYRQEPHTEIDHQDPQFLIEENEFVKKLRNAINGLTEKQREAFLLSRIEKKTYREVSEIVGISIKAVEKRINSALSNLRESLGDVFL